MTQVDHSGMANAIRGLAMDAVEKAIGHPRPADGAADVATVLFTQFLKFDAADPRWPNRDRFILSAGHGDACCNALLYLTGNTDMTLDQLKHFRQLGSLSRAIGEFPHQGHRDHEGPLGQGIATWSGFALAEKMSPPSTARKLSTINLCARLRRRPDGGRIAGSDALAGHWKLNKLIVLYDDNGKFFDRRPLSIAVSVDQVKRFKIRRLASRTHRWSGSAGDRRAITRAQKSNKPSMIACRPPSATGHRPGPAPRKRMAKRLAPMSSRAPRRKLGISLEPFSVPPDVLKSCGAKSAPAALRARGVEARFARTALPQRTDSNDACGTSGRPVWESVQATRRRCLRRRRISPPQIVGTCDRGDRAGDAGISGGLGRSHRHP